MLRKINLNVLKTVNRVFIIKYEHFNKSAVPASEVSDRLPVDKFKNEISKHADTFGNYSEIVSKFDVAKDDPEDLKERKRRKLMDRRSPIYYINAIKLHLDKHEFDKAMEFLEERMLKIDKVKPDSYVYDLLISYCGRIGNVKDAFRLYNQIKKRGYNVTGGQYTSIFNACANSQMSQYSLEVASKVRNYLSQDELHKANVKNYNSMIKAFGRHGDLKTCLEIMDEVLERRGRVRDDTYNFLLQACVSDRGGGFRHALLIWHKMLQNKTDPSTFSFNLMLRVTRDCSFGVPEQIESVIKSILNEGRSRHLRKLQIHDVKPYTLPDPKKEPTIKLTAESVGNVEDNQVIQKSSNQLASENNEASEDGIQSRVDCVVHLQDNGLSLRDEERMKLPNLLAVIPKIGGVVDLAAFNTGYHRLMLLGGVTGFLQVMDSIKVKPDMKTFTLLLGVIPSNQRAEEDLMNLVRMKKLKFDTKFFNALIKNRSFRKDYAAAKDVLGLMQAEGLKADIITFGVLALGCKTREDGEELINNLHDAGFRANSEILGALVRQAIYAGDIVYVKKVLSTMQEDDVLPSAKLMVLLNDFMDKQKDRLGKVD